MLDVHGSHPPGEQSSILVGRERELDTLRRAWQAACAGAPRTILVEGVAGIGKTALIERLVQDVGCATVLRTSADETETTTRLALVDQLMRVAGVRRPGLLPDLGAADSAANHVSAGTRVLELLDALQEDGPVLLVVDDAHWADAQSLGAILFAVRRLTADRVLVIVAARDGGTRAMPEGFRKAAAPPRGATITVGPLLAGELSALAAAQGVHLSRAAARRLHEHTAGNPLYARSLLAELPADAWLEVESLPAPSPFSALVRNRVVRCSPECQRLLDAVAVLGSGAPRHVAAKLAELDDPLAALDEAVRADLLCERDRSRLGGPDLAFTHPLIRAAVYAALRTRRRTELHARAAALVPDRRWALRHAATGAGGPDAQLAQELDDLAREEAQRGDWAASAEDLRTASSLSDDGAAREERYLRALDGLVLAGQVELARRLAVDAQSFAATAHRDLVLANLAFLSSHPADAEPLFHSAWSRCDAQADPALAMNVARRFAVYWLLQMRSDLCVQWSERAVGTMALSGEPSETRALIGDAHAVHAAALARLGRFGEAHAALAGALQASGELGAAVGSFRGWLHLLEDDVDAALSDLARGAPAALRCGLLDLAAASYTFLARAEYVAGRWDDAALHARTAAAIALDHEHALSAFVWDAGVCVAASRGDFELAELLLSEANSKVIACDDRTAWLGVAQAMVASNRGDPARVLAALEPLTGLARDSGIEEPGVWPWQELYADALVETGELARAEAFLRHHELIATARGRDSAIARLARVRGKLQAARGNPADAELAFSAAVEHGARVGMPFEQALSELAYGGFLRRQGLRRAALARLSEAHDALAALGARPALERCERELGLCGLAPSKRTQRPALRLTPAERSVTRLVASGLSNPEVAAQLMVSVRTIEYHLTRIYSKLGLRSRGQLAARVAAGEYVSLGVQPAVSPAPDVGRAAGEAPAGGPPDEPAG